MAETIAFTIAFGTEARAAARLLRLTFKAQHPDIPFLIIDDSFYPDFAGQREIAHAGEIMGLRIMIGYFLSLCYRQVIHLDSDILVLAPLPYLVERTEVAVLTHDAPNVDYGLPTTPINAGVLAAANPEFWRCWMITNYSFILPSVGNFFDQFSLRVLCMRNMIPHILIPETEERDYYNITYHQHPGPWRREGTAVYKGDARVRLWHWAGYVEKCTLDYLPEPVGLALRELLRGVSSRPTLREIDLFEERRVRQILREKGHSFWALVAGEIVGLSTHRLDMQHQDKTVQDVIFGTDIPAAWDALRPAMPGFHRRFLPQAPRYIYAVDRKHLFTEEAEKYNQPWKKIA